MDIRKVQSVVKEIYEGGSIQVNITEDIENLDNKDKVVAIGTLKTIRYEYHTASDMINDYFTIIEEDNKQLLNLINNMAIQRNQYFPIFAFSKINHSLEKENELKEKQISKLNDVLSGIKDSSKSTHTLIEDIESDNKISKTNKCNAIIYGLSEGNISLDDLKKYLEDIPNKRVTEYRKLLCAYDFYKYADTILLDELKKNKC